MKFNFPLESHKRICSEISGCFIFRANSIVQQKRPTKGMKLFNEVFANMKISPFLDSLPFDSSPYSYFSFAGRVRGSSLDLCIYRNELKLQIENAATGMEIKWLKQGMRETG